MLGYWKQPDETAKVMRNGWLLTGDIGYRDPEGYYFITDRKKDMLLVNGINVYPREIEEVLYQFPGVKEAAVIGKPDPRRGEQPIAFVAANDGAVLEEKGHPAVRAAETGGLQGSPQSGAPARPAPQRHRQDPQDRAARAAVTRLRLTPKRGGWVSRGRRTATEAARGAMPVCPRQPVAPAEIVPAFAKRRAGVVESQGSTASPTATAGCPAPRANRAAVPHPRRRRRR